MVFKVITGNGVVMPQLIFPYGLRLNTDVNIKILEDEVQP